MTNLLQVVVLSVTIQTNVTHHLSIPENPAEEIQDYYTDHAGITWMAEIINRHFPPPAPIEPEQVREAVDRVENEIKVNGRVDAVDSSKRFCDDIKTILAALNKLENQSPGVASPTAHASRPAGEVDGN